MTCSAILQTWILRPFHIGEMVNILKIRSGKRGKALPSMLAVLAQDPDTGIIDYGDVNLRHENQSAVVLEYLDFYEQSNHGRKELRYLVVDSKFTNYENLNKLMSGLSP